MATVRLDDAGLRFLVHDSVLLFTAAEQLDWCPPLRVDNKYVRCPLGRRPAAGADRVGVMRSRGVLLDENALQP